MTGILEDAIGPGYIEINGVETDTEISTDIINNNGPGE